MKEIMLIQHLKENYTDGKPWLIVGTGPTLHNWNPELAKSYNIWTINAAIDVTQYADICSMLDYEIYSDPSRFINKFPKEPYPTAILTKRENKGKSPIWKNTIYRDEIFDATTSIETAFGALIHIGVKEVFTIGVDGGKGVVYSGLSEAYYLNEAASNFDQHNEFINELVSKGVVKWTKL